MIGSGLASALATAGLLGVTHAIEPDHVAGISSLTSRYGDAKLSAAVGACFSVGHVSLVVAWLAIGYVLLGRTSFAPVYDALGMIGVAILLGLLGATMVVGGLRSMVHTHEHDGRAHAHVHLPFGLGHEGANHDHDHDRGLGEYLRIGAVGALFTLSPPVSMIVFSATLFPTHGSSVVAAAVLAYAVAITATMGALGAGVGVLFDAFGERPRLHAASRTVAGLAVSSIAVIVLADAVSAL